MACANGLTETDPLTLCVRRVLTAGFEHRQVGLSSVALAIGMSSRTLRRRLSALGTTFQAILDELRRDAACHRLGQSDDSVALIAERLGFASTSSFQRAFRRWTGLSPSAFRARERRERARSRASSGDAHKP